MRLQDIDTVCWVKLQKTLFQLLMRLDKNLSPAQFLMAIAVLFMSACRRLKVRPLDVIERAARIRQDMIEGSITGEGKSTIRVVDSFMDEELKDYEWRPYEREVREVRARLESRSSRA